jgi:hypothetical protein
VIGPPQILAEARCCAELVDAFRSRKEELKLSNEAVEHLLQLCAGHVDKILSQTRGLSQLSIDGLLSAMGLKLLVAIDPEQVARMAPRWENEGHRDAKQVRRPPARIRKVLMARVRPLILREAATRAARARWRGTSPELRSTLMRQVARARWHACADASEPAAEQETATQ